MTNQRTHIDTYAILAVAKPC